MEVCDDEADIREMLAEYPTRRGFRVSEAANAGELDARLAAEAPSVLVLDINMPREDGLWVLKRAHLSVEFELRMA